MESFTIPLKLICTISKKEKTFTNRSYIEKKINEYGSLENLKQKYICREAKSLLKDNSRVIETPNLKAVIGTEKISNHSNENLCMNPNWYKAKKACNACAFFAVCTHNLKFAVEV
jgi:hypothetical protein